MGWASVEFGFRVIERKTKLVLVYLDQLIHGQDACRGSGRGCIIRGNSIRQQ